MPSNERNPAISVVFAATLVSTLGACRSAHRDAVLDADATAASSARSSREAGPPAAHEQGDAGPLASGIPVPAAKVEAVMNSEHRPPYAGKTGSVEGTVRISGDAPPPSKLEIPPECTDAVAMYGRLFREGPGRTAADVLVAVTEYDGYVPAGTDSYPISIRGCAFDSRTLALAYGQRIEIHNDDDNLPYLPALVGANLPARFVAIPHGEPVRLYPNEPGHYVLGDTMGRTWMYADVFVVRYATHAVTRLDGRYALEGIPVGRVKVSAYLPAIGQTVDRQVEVEAGQATRVDFVLPFKVKKEPKPAASAPAGPTIK